MVHKLSCKIGDEELVLETGRMAKQANGAVFATFGGSAIIATACCSSEVKEGLDFVPVTVEYNEKFYAAGKIPGGFVKRETRPKDREILVSRIIDRPMRPLFYKAFGRELQVVPTCVSFDGVEPAGRHRHRRRERGRPHLRHPLRRAHRRRARLPRRRRSTSSTRPTTR